MAANGMVTVSKIFFVNIQSTVITLLKYPGWIYTIFFVILWHFSLINTDAGTYDGYFSEVTKSKLKVKKNSFWYKIVPFKECQSRPIFNFNFNLFPRIVEFFVISIIMLSYLICLIIHLLFIQFINVEILKTIFWVYFGLRVLFEVIMFYLSYMCHI